MVFFLQFCVLRVQFKKIFLEQDFVIHVCITKYIFPQKNNEQPLNFFLKSKKKMKNRGIWVFNEITQIGSHCSINFLHF